MGTLKRKILFILTALLVFMNGMVVFAAGEGDWGMNIRDWIVRQASALAIAAVVIVVVPLIYKKAWSALIGTIFASGIGLFVVNSPESLKKIGDILYGIIFK
jgi:peptidoglycan/LPS O-acetylase OafA/YrhL